MSVFVCSDIHGQYALYRRMLKAIGFSSNDTLYVIGDMIDRGPESIPVLLDMMGRDNVVPVIGNHELMMYNHYRKMSFGDYWFNLSNGGLQTKRSFDKLSKAEKDRVLDYISKMYLQKELEIEGKKFLLSHSAFMAGLGDLYWKQMSYREAFTVVWYSPWRFMEHLPFEFYEEDKDREHIIGHVPVPYIMADEGVIMEKPCVYKGHNLINIDLGCAAMEQAGLEQITGLCLCAMNLTEYAKGNEEECFTYVMRE